MKSGVEIRGMIFYSLLFAYHAATLCAALYTASDCSFPSSATETNALWEKDFRLSDSFNPKLFSSTCYDLLVKSNRLSPSQQHQIIAKSNQFPLETKQHIIDLSDGVPFLMTPEGEDCDRLNFERASDFFLANLTEKCFQKLSTESVQSLIKNPRMMKNLKLDYLKEEHYELFIPLLLENEEFLSIQRASCPIAEELLKRIDETKITDSYSALLNQKMLFLDFSSKDPSTLYEGKRCSEELLDSDSIECTLITGRCIHHITKSFPVEKFQKISQKCGKDLAKAIRGDTYQLAINDRCVPEVYTLLRPSSLAGISLEKLCQESLVSLPDDFIALLADAELQSLSKNVHFSALKSLDSFSSDQIASLLPGVTVEQINATKLELLQEISPHPALNQFSSNEVYEAFIARVGLPPNHKIDPSVTKQELSDDVVVNGEPPKATKDENSGAIKIDLSFLFILLFLAQ